VAYTFDPSLPTLKDEARQALGLTDVSSVDTAVFADETILARLNRFGPNAGMAKLCEEFANILDAEPIKVSQQLGASIEWVRNRSAGLRDYAKRLRNGTDSFGDPAPTVIGGSAEIADPVVDTSRIEY
jgi:hypothetical protein